MMPGGTQPADPVLAEVKRFLREEAQFAQLFTVGAEGYPVGRTVGAPINDDWSVDLVQRRVHRRLRHIARNPRVEIVWVGTPRPGSRNDRPAVFDYGWLVPRAVFLRGIAEPMTEEETLAAYHRLRAPLLAAGLTRAPDRSAEDVRENLAGVHVRPVRLRAEGFGEGAESFTWPVEELK
ncbi:MAG TPA: pyridoxamine 5'-phosphate oxidase family protein [Micromonosporaceae bacterium]|nr:pyridoxamine 5'-phosphate oxidase family protein [Micromonosporaceae bacterium]